MACPPDPPVQFHLCFLDILHLEKQAQDLLLLGEMLRGFSQRESRVLGCLGICFGGSNSLCVMIASYETPFPSGMYFQGLHGLSVGLPPYLAMKFIQSIRRPLSDMEGVDAALVRRNKFIYTVRNPSGSVTGYYTYTG